jgi:hypothetical protein
MISGSFVRASDLPVFVLVVEMSICHLCACSRCLNAERINVLSLSERKFHRTQPPALPGVLAVLLRVEV